jgi:hypothetical protein
VADLTDIVRQVPPWALWLELGLGWMGMLAVLERLRMGRAPVLLTLLGASCMAFGACGLALRLIDPTMQSPLERHAAAEPAPEATASR